MESRKIKPFALSTEVGTKENDQSQVIAENVAANSASFKLELRNSHAIDKKLKQEVKLRSCIFKCLVFSNDKECSAKFIRSLESVSTKVNQGAVKAKVATDLVQEHMFCIMGVDFSVIEVFHDFKTMRTFLDDAFTIFSVILVDGVEDMQKVAQDAMDSHGKHLLALQKLDRRSCIIFYVPSNYDKEAFVSVARESSARSVGYDWGLVHVEVAFEEQLNYFPSKFYDFCQRAMLHHDLAASGFV